MNCDYTDKIIDYLDNNLNELDKNEFENHLKNNKQFQDIVQDIKYQSKLIKNLPEYKASSDFMVSLNKRIDKHESKYNKSWLNWFKFNKSQFDYAPLLGVVSIVVIVCFSLFKVSDYSNYTLENNYESSIAMDDLDSLKNEYDENPILLLGNEK